MPFDAHKNLAISAVTVAPVPPDTGTSLTVATGQGARFPAPPFNATVWQSGSLPTPITAEVVRVTAIAGDVLTVVRQAEGTRPRLVVIGDLIAETITAKALQDIESGTNFPLITTPGDITSTAGAIRAPLGQFDFVGVATTLDAASITAETVDASSQMTAPVGRFGSLDTTPLNPAFIIAPIPDAKLSVNVLTHAGGYPGGTTTFLRADGTFVVVSAVGPPSLHAPTHALGGTDPVSVTGLAGYPGGTGLFLRADATFAAPPGGGGVPAHASTHVPGGSDPIPNVAWTNLANTFTGNQTVNGNVTVANPGGNLTVAGNLIFGPSGSADIRQATADGTDTGSVFLCGGGGDAPSRGAAIRVGGNENPSLLGAMQLSAGNTASGSIDFLTGNSSVRGRMFASGGFSWGNTIDPGTGSFGLSGRLAFVTNPGLITPATVDGADTLFLTLAGGGAGSANRGSYINVFGNDGGSGGRVELVAGDPSGKIFFYTGATLVRGVIHESGGFSWGSSFDPGAGVLLVGANSAPGNNFIYLSAGLQISGVIGTGAASHLLFQNSNGTIGTITSSGSATSYNTTSDARLKTDRGPLVGTVLPGLHVRLFDWNTGGEGRGLFAQEAVETAPFAVTMGTNEVDAAGRFTHPWQVDYSKLVPDLIAGWQQHAAQIAALEAALARLTDKGFSDAH